MHDQVGQHLGNYRVLRLLGQGGKASVYLGEHVSLGSHAALKVLHTHLTEMDAEAFLREAQMLARLSHPHIVRVLDFAVEDGMPFLVMEYAPHGTLRQRHPKGTRLPLDVIIPYVQQVASALQYTHDQGLIHRDVKPENMLLSSDDEVLLSDFGLVMLAPHLLSSEATEPMEQVLAGTTAYLAPEEVRGKAQPASDQYALGVVVYEWLCGKPPFSGPFLEVAVKLVSASPPSLREQMPELSPAIEEVVLQALAKEPEQRFARVQDFTTALERAYQEAISPRLTPVLTLERGAETAKMKSPLRTLPTGTVTMLFTDMEGSTHLLQQLGERYTDVLAECRQLLRTAFRAFGGHEIDTQGDAFFVAFARATEAVSAAVAAQRTLARHPWPEGVTVRVRMGLHTGEPELSSEGYVGLDVHYAARMMRAGHGGQVLLSQTTRDLVEHDLPDGVSLRDLGEHRLKDLQRPSPLYQLVIADLPADFPPLKTLESRPNNLPVQLTPLIGREQEVAAVQNLLQRENVRLVTLTGPGGTGKTRLGLQVAAELCDWFPDGVYFVNLAPLSDPAFVIPTIAQALGLREVAGQPLLEHVKGELHQKQLLLVLDNFEQVVRAAPQLVDLLAACPKLKLLVTSREVLHVRAEHEFAVPPLALPDPTHLPALAELSHYAAVTLFLQRAQAARPEFQLTTANAQAIAEICVHLDGLPLAIELAAARIKLLPPQGLLARLGHRLEVLTSKAQDVPARHQTLRNTIAWSYQLLDAQEQRLFRQLSAFVGGCTLEAIEAVCAALDKSNGAGGVLDGVASLIDKSLLQRTGQEGEEPRLVMLETIREYGLEVLEASGGMEASRQAHAHYYLELAEEAERELEGLQAAVALERLEREHDNLRAVMRWSLERGEMGHSIEMALRLGGALWRLWDVRGHWSEGRNFLERALAGSKGVAVPVQVKALRAAASLADNQGDTDRAEALYEESLARCRELGDTGGIALSLRRLGDIACSRSNLVVANSLTEEALALFREVGDKEGIAWSLANFAHVVSQQGEYARAIALHEEALALFREVGHKAGIVQSHVCLAEMLFFSQGDPARVHALLQEGLALSRELGHKEGIADGIALSGQLALSQGDEALARCLIEESLVLHREMGDRWGIARSLFVLGRVAESLGDYAAARALYEESLAIGRVVGNNRHIASCLEGLAGLFVAQGEPVRAVRLWGAADALREAMGTPIPPVYGADYERSLAAARAQLGEKAFAAAWAEGRLMTPEQALTAQGKAMIPTPMPARPASTTPAKSPTHPAGLTAREVEVLCLLATGLTDAQIAEQLVLSLHTVHAHLRTIYSKLGVTSRSAATRYAFEHQLV